MKDRFLQLGPGPGHAKRNERRLMMQRTIHGHRPPAGFSLIEILVVISIIALLATLTVGLTGVASRKNKEARVKADLNKLVTAIEGYKSAVGMFPRDNPGRPSTNQLFYELSGTYFDGGQYSLADQSEKISANVVNSFFNAPGFGNAVRRGDQPKYTYTFQPGQFKEVSRNPDIEVLVSPIEGPPTFTYNGVTAALPLKAGDGTVINPWLYDSSSAFRNNRNGFDLWTEVVIGRNIVRFSNWEKDPVIVGRAP